MQLCLTPKRFAVLIRKWDGLSSMCCREKSLLSNVTHSSHEIVTSKILWYLWICQIDLSGIHWIMESKMFFPMFLSIIGPLCNNIMIVVFTKSVTQINSQIIISHWEQESNICPGVYFLSITNCLFKWGLFWLTESKPGANIHFLFLSRHTT